MDYGAFHADASCEMALAGLADFDFDAVTEKGEHFVCVIWLRLNLSKVWKLQWAFLVKEMHIYK